jgi:thymidylate kinase
VVERSSAALARYGRTVSESQHLIVIRGNSGSGKTTLARDLQLSMGRRTANIGQDHLRRIVLREHDLPDADNIGLIAHTARYCLAIGYHVIVEGILHADHYRSMLCELAEGHPGPTDVFYLDIGLEETLRRHAGRPLAAEVEPERLREWYRAHDVLGVPGEVVLDANQTAQETLAAVRKHIGPVTPHPDIPGGRFL